MPLIETLSLHIYRVAACCSSRSTWFLPRTPSSRGVGRFRLPDLARSALPLTVRTEFLLRYAQDEELRRRIKKACKDAENWNSFHEALLWANGGRLRSDDPLRQEETLLALNLLMDAIVYYTVDEHGPLLKRMKAPTPVVWEHIGILAR
jgi:hypothetical protein